MQDTNRIVDALFRQSSLNWRVNLNMPQNMGYIYLIHKMEKEPK